jgi:hypothetical protein
MRISADGFIDIRDGRKVRTPGKFTSTVEPLPEAEAASFLFSHSFPGHRRVIRGLTTTECRLMRMAAWATSVSERMSLVDRVWRSITEPIPAPKGGEPELVQVVQVGGWGYPLYLEGTVTRVQPPGGVPMGEVRNRKLVTNLERKTA